MKNKVTVTIADREYTLVGTENEAYVQKLAAYVDQQISGVMSSGRVSMADGAVLAAINIADELLKEQAASENLRRQLKDDLEDAAKLKMELSEAKREIFKLQNKK